MVVQFLLQLQSLNLFYDATHDKGVLYSFQPTVAWKPLIFGAQTFSFISWGSNQGLFQDQGGNVGIGTTSPNAKLDVNGGPAGNGYHTLTPVMFGTVNGGAGALSDGLTIQRVGSGGIITPAIKLANYFSGNVAQDVVAIDFTTGDGNGVGSTVGRISVETLDVDPFMAFSVAGSEYARIDKNGNMAIGTTDSKSYKFAVNGAAIVTSMTVKLYANWPDYVFKPTYKLPSL